MQIISYRGTNQIGGTCIEVRTSNTRIILDIGSQLPPKDTSSLPKVEGLFEGDNFTNRVDAILISHGHSDHYGLHMYTIKSIPLYIGEKSQEIVNTNALFTNSKPISNPCTPLISGMKFTVGDFEITPFAMDHSFCDAYAFLIVADGKKIIYTGDFRNHGVKKKCFDYFLYNIPTVDLLMIEGTTVGRKSYKNLSEGDLENDFKNIFSSQDKVHVVSVSSHNLDRIMGLYNVAKDNSIDRLLVLDIYTANFLNIALKKDKVKRFMNMLIAGKIKIYFPLGLTKRIEKVSPNNIKPFRPYEISFDEINKCNRICFLTRPTLLEYLKEIKDINGGTFIHSNWSGCLDDVKVKNMIDYVTSQGMIFKKIHTSGHATISAIKKVVASANPKVIMPVHTERQDLFKTIFNDKNVILLKDLDIYTIP